MQLNISAFIGYPYLANQTVHLYDVSLKPETGLLVHRLFLAGTVPPQLQTQLSLSAAREQSAQASRLSRSDQTLKIGSGRGC